MKKIGHGRKIRSIKHGSVNTTHKREMREIFDNIRPGYTSLFKYNSEINQCHLDNKIKEILIGQINEYYKPWFSDAD